MKKKAPMKKHKDGMDGMVHESKKHEKKEEKMLKEMKKDIKKGMKRDGGKPKKGKLY